MKCLNLGCGSRFHPDWTNLDLNFTNAYVQHCDLRQRLPFEDHSFDVVYHSHLLEHLRKADALGFLQECGRVLKPGGILRVAIPDLEGIVKAYLEALDRALEGQRGSEHDYEWMVMELYDQAVREWPGGEMLKYLRRNPIPNEAFVLQRMGTEARDLIQRTRKQYLEKKPPRSRLHRLVRRFYGVRRSLRQAIAKVILAEEERKALEIGQFRLQGEVHQWVYDRYSLARLLEEAGFQNPTQRTAFESAIPNWSDFQLDTESDGSVYKPDSLYMEAVKPG